MKPMTLIDFEHLEIVDFSKKEIRDAIAVALRERENSLIAKNLKLWFKGPEYKAIHFNADGTSCMIYEKSWKTYENFREYVLSHREFKTFQKLINYINVYCR